MKRSFFLPLLFSLLLIACSKSEDDPTTLINDNKLMKITIETSGPNAVKHTTDEAYYGSNGYIYLYREVGSLKFEDYFFTYDASENIVKLEYYHINLEEKTKRVSTTIEYNYSGNGLLQTTDISGNNPTQFILNNEGKMIEVYDVPSTDSSMLKYTWENGNLTKVETVYPDSMGPSMSIKYDNNKSILNCPFLPYVSLEHLPFFRYNFNALKNNPIEMTIHNDPDAYRKKYTFNYTFNSVGNPEKVVIQSDDNVSWVYNISYSTTYKSLIDYPY